LNEAGFFEYLVDGVIFFHCYYSFFLAA